MTAMMPENDHARDGVPGLTPEPSRRAASAFSASAWPRGVTPRVFVTPRPSAPFPRGLRAVESAYVTAGGLGVGQHLYERTGRIQSL